MTEMPQVFTFCTRLFYLSPEALATPEAQRELEEPAA